MLTLNIPRLSPTFGARDPLSTSDHAALAQLHQAAANSPGQTPDDRQRATTRAEGHRAAAAAKDG